MSDYPKQSQATADHTPSTTGLSDRACQPVPGAEGAVPWPLPLPAGAVVFTFWGTKNAKTENFALSGDAALRILANAGPFKLMIQGQEESILEDIADLRQGGLALMAIPQSGTYSLVIEAPAEWGVSVVTRYHPPTTRVPTATMLEGSVQPSDVFQPYMPRVRALANIGTFFAEVRTDFATAAPQAKGQRYFAVVTPSREVIGQTCPAPETMPPDVINSAMQLFPPSLPVTISVISHTAWCHTIEDMSRCIPFLGYLVGFASVGHRVVVFEGHPSALESGVRDTDVLFMDSGMLPFVQRDWADVARRVMRPNSMIFVHDRETYSLRRL